MAAGKQPRGEVLKVTKAIFPVAGLGTRFLPVTKASPKEMLPIVDKPLIQFAVEEAVAAGIDHMVFVTGRNKRAIEDHFDKAYELETELSARGRDEMLEQVQDILPKHVTCSYVRQSVALGLGHAVLCAKAVVRDEPFAVILADDLIDAQPGCLAQMVAVFDQRQRSVIAVQDVPREDTGSYGIVEGEPDGDRLLRLTAIVEKPEPEKAPSTLAVVGRYVLAPAVMRHLEQIEAGAGGEIQLTDAIASLLRDETVLGYRFEGRRYDCGAKLGYLEANVMFGLEHPETGAEFRRFLQRLAAQDGR
ncbi:MAG: UTP--glucose-1-phosphate uridylyltransferase GalU [Burkholderiales bacterium]|nr:UTP--glucose-1-phosphate uridylyltransferase GalU [Burkholderiales bacterium]